MKKILINSLVLLLLLNSCSKSSNYSNGNSTPCTSGYNSCSVVAPQAEIDAVAKYLSDQKIYDTIKHCSGMFYKIDKPGTGNAPDICSTITIKYTGRLTNGTVFEQANSLTYLLEKFIVGLKNGIPLIKEGGTIHIYIPPSLAYGSQVLQKIPANSILIFDVDLITIQ